MPQSHPRLLLERYCFGGTSVFILFQPHCSFVRKTMGEPEAWRSMAGRVRKMFEDRGRGYQPFTRDHNMLRKIGAYLPDWYWLAHSSDGAAPCPDVGAQTARHFIFGYGSLISLESRAHTSQSTGSKTMPATISGLQRSWTARAEGVCAIAQCSDGCTAVSCRLTGDPSHLTNVR